MFASKEAVSSQWSLVVLRLDEVVVDAGLSMVLSYSKNLVFMIGTLTTYFWIFLVMLSVEVLGSQSRAIWRRKLF